MERRRKAGARQPSRRVKQDKTDDQEAIVLPLPHIAELIEFGEITLGNKYPMGCVAVACDEGNCLAMLVRRDGETLAQLLTRLDQAIARALDDDIYTDEINPRS